MFIIMKCLDPVVVILTKPIHQQVRIFNTTLYKKHMSYFQVVLKKIRGITFICISNQILKVISMDMLKLK